MRERFSKAELGEIWRRWREGESVASIARALRCSSNVVGTQLRAHGGISPRAKKQRSGSLSLAEREEISLLLAQDYSGRAIAQKLGRDAGAICREINRNGGRAFYRAVSAQQRAEQQIRRPKLCKLQDNERLCEIVASKLECNWSPEQISGWLKVEFDCEPRMQISPETIYRSLFVQTRGVLKKQLAAHLRSHRTMRRTKAASRRPDARGSFGEFVSISERPAEVEDRAIPGHWEGDLLTGSLGNCIATLVERTSRYVMLVKVDKNDTAVVISALRKHIVRLPAELRKSLTWDRGPEIRRHKELSVAADVAVYICDPQSPWQRGSNENTNGLLRQYFPKGVSVAHYTQKELDAVARQLNERPRKTLGFKTPAEVFGASVAMTG